MALLRATIENDAARTYFGFTSEKDENYRALRDESEGLMHTRKITSKTGAGTSVWDELLDDIQKSKYLEASSEKFRDEPDEARRHLHALVRCVGAHVARKTGVGRKRHGTLKNNLEEQIETLDMPTGNDTQPPGMFVTLCCEQYADWQAGDIQDQITSTGERSAPGPGRAQSSCTFLSP